MIHVQVGLYIEFEKRLTAFSLSKKILHGLAGDRLESIQEDIVRIKKPDDKISIIWSPEACDIRIENTEDVPKSIGAILTVLEKINKLVPITRINTRRAINYWILPTSKYNFNELAQIYMGEMLSSNNEYPGVYDTSVLMDIRRKEKNLHHQSGAMTVEQLQRDFLRYDLTNIQTPFIFLEAAIIDLQPILFSVDELRKFMLNSFDECKLHSEEFARNWGGKL